MTNKEKEEMAKKVEIEDFYEQGRRFENNPCRQAKEYFDYDHPGLVEHNCGNQDQFNIYLDGCFVIILILSSIAVVTTASWIFCLEWGCYDKKIEMKKTKDDQN